MGQSPGNLHPRADASQHRDCVRGGRGICCRVDASEGEVCGMRGACMRVLLVVLAVVLVLSAMPGAAVAREARWREGGVIGLAYGPARAKIEGDSLESKWLEGPAQSLRLGWMLHRTVKLGYEHQAWLREQGVYDLKVHAGVQLEALALTVFPWSPGKWTAGFYGIGGGGYAHCRLTFLERLAPGESPIGNTYEAVWQTDEDGWGWFAGLGYELPITRTFSASAMLTYNAVEIGGDVFGSAQYVPLTASLNWSF